MSWTALPEIDEQAARLAESVCAEKSGCLRIKGGLSVGKSTLLRRIKKQLEAQGMQPILIAPPAGALDAFSVSLTQLASQIYNGEPSSAEVSRLLRDQTVKAFEKHERLASWLAKGKDRFVLLCDDPVSWQGYSDSYPGRAENLSSLYRTLLDTHGLRTVVTGLMPEGRRASQDYKVHAISSPEAWLKSEEAWGSCFTENARELWEACGQDLCKKTPLAIRLMVGLMSLGETPRHLMGLQRKDLAERLWQRLSDDPELYELRQAWASLALIREGFQTKLLDVVGAPRETSKAGQLLRHCLLFEEEGQFILHEMLRADVKSYLEPSARRNVHAKIAGEYYLPLFQNLSRGEVSKALTHEVEAYYHAATSGQAVEDLRPFFAEQLNLLGRYLSEQEHQFEEAASVFKRAITWEPEDDYAHHYFAYNLDYLGRRASEVEQHYREAVRLRNDHPWWWSRLICFLLTRGRIEQAESAWADALDSLVFIPNDQVAGSRVHSDLHGHVLNNALYFSQLHFADRVLNDIPETVRQNDPHLLACQRRLEALELAANGRAVVPMPDLKKGWWTEGPFELPRQLNSGHTLERWFAVRVEAVVDSKVDLRLAETPVDGVHEPEVLLATFALDQLQEWSLTTLAPKTGDYWEIGAYRRGDNEQYRLFVRDHVRFQEADEQLFRIEPDPERYRFGNSR